VFVIEPGSSTIAAVIAIAIGLGACVTDLRSRRIPNVLTFGSAFIAFAYYGVIAGPAGLLQSLAGWGTGILMFLPFFALRGLGGGDVKLLGALGAWLGAGTVLWVALFAGIVGGALALALTLTRGELPRVLRNFYLLFGFWRVMGLRPFPELSLDRPGAPRLAYAVPIFAGLSLALWLK
jgi:prepilin peptidase CpaA